jgi:hypothetical protein
MEEKVLNGIKCPPVLFLTFNRPQNTARVLERIKSAKPPFLCVACDGPRYDNPEDVVRIRAIHEMISEVDWCSNIKTLYRDNNLGCGRAVSEAITWFFNHVDEGVILEDDCLPDLSFFSFCSEMLDRYRSTDNVMQIAGYNPLSGQFVFDADYFFSHLGCQWGWATWKRAWKCFDFNMIQWATFKKYKFHKSNMCYPDFILGCNRMVQQPEDRKDTWDVQWHFACASRSGLSVVPVYSLIENMGFNSEATHTADRKSMRVYNVDVRPIIFPIKDCPFIYPYPGYDDRLVRKRNWSWLRRVKNWRLLKNL